MKTMLSPLLTVFNNILKTVALLFILLVAPVEIFSQQQSYNVLFIATDDMNDRLGILGNPELITPNMQRLANRGMVFTEAYAQYPLCNPSRTSVLSGWRPEHTQVLSNSVRPSTVMGNNVLYLPDFFHQYGYRTERYGKIAHNLFESDVKWDYAEPGDQDDGEGNSLKIMGLNTGSAAGTGADWWIKNIPDSTTEDGQIAGHFLKRLKQPESAPFFYGLGFQNSHNPFTPSLHYWNKNGNPDVQQALPVNKSGSLGNIKGNGSSNISIPATPLNDRADVPSIAFSGVQKTKTDSVWKHIMHAYDSEIEQLDAQLGLVLDELDRQNLWSNTIVVFWSDHGQHLGEHEGQWLKMTLFEESLHVPLIVCVPGKKPGVCNKLVELVDLYPTLAELCGLQPPAGLEGSSFARLLDNPQLPWKRAAFSQVIRSPIPMGRSVRTEQYRYTSWAQLGEELYDHNADPHEYTNLALNPDYAQVLAMMRKIMREGWTQSLPPLCKDLISYRDADGDGFGSTVDSIFSCTVPPGYVSVSGDFNDKDSIIHQILTTYYRDADGDGYGNPLISLKSSTAPVGYVTDNTDCEDNNNYVHPGAPDICNGIDDNCNGVIDENAITASINPSGAYNLCNGSQVILNANSGNNLTYHWFRNGSSAAEASNSSFPATKAGSYYVIERDNLYCNSTSPDTKITLVSPPAAKINYSGSLDICTTGSLLLKANFGTDFIYQWQKNRINIPGAVKRQFNASSTGTYNVIVTDSNGCSRLSAGVVITNSCGLIASEAVIKTDLSMQPTRELFGYPNPSDGKFKLSYYAVNAGKIQIRVFDASGKKVFSTTNTAVKGNNQFDLDLSSLAQEMYHLELTNNTSHLNIKVSIVH